MSLPYFRWYPGDYVRDTRHLSMLQHGAYRQLIDEYMTHGPLPNDLNRLYRSCSAFSNEERAAIEHCLAEFFILDGPVWRHKRCDKEREYQEKFSASQRDRIAKRWKQGDHGPNTAVIPGNNRGNTGWLGNTKPEPEPDKTNPQTPAASAGASGAKRRKPTPRQEGTNPRALGTNPKALDGTWCESEPETIAMGLRYHLHPRPGEGWDAFRRRIQTAIELAKRLAERE